MMSPVAVPRKRRHSGGRGSRRRRRSFRWTFHRPQLHPTRPDSPESPPNLTSTDLAGPHRPEDRQLSPKQQVAGSSPARVPGHPLWKPPSQLTASTWATTNFDVTETYRRRRAGCASVPGLSLAVDCWSTPTPFVVRPTPGPRASGGHMTLLRGMSIDPAVPEAADTREWQPQGQGGNRHTGLGQVHNLNGVKEKLGGGQLLPTTRRLSLHGRRRPATSQASTASGLRHLLNSGGSTTRLRVVVPAGL
jgi:hypothetical protein